MVGAFCVATYEAPLWGLAYYYYMYVSGVTCSCALITMSDGEGTATYGFASLPG